MKIIDTDKKEKHGKGITLIAPQAATAAAVALYVTG